MLLIGSSLEPIGGWLVTALALILASWFLVHKKRRRPRAAAPRLTTAALAAWSPKPFVEEEVVCETPPLMGKLGEGMLNMGSMSFLALDQEERIKIDAITAVRKYGVGSCGPRGFYGTIDVHLELEQRLAELLDVQETCVYSYGFSTISSAISSYAKRQDIIFADEAVWFAIQKGIEASRCTVRYFRHNDASDLERKLSEAEASRELSPRRRAFLVVEAVYYNTGEMCCLRDVVRLARKYKLRILLDESLSIGVLGERGRGLTEHLGVPRDEVDLIMGSLEHAFAGAGGFCAGSHFIVEHQRLSGLGYCFSASLPPPLTRAAITALDILEQRPHMLWELRDATLALHRSLKNLKHYRSRGHELSPVQHLYLDSDADARTQSARLRRVADACRARGVALAVAAYLDEEVHCPQPSIRLTANRKLTQGEIDKVCKALDEAYEECAK